MDHVDKIIEQWKKECPDLDISAMALIGRIKRIEPILAKRMGETFAAHDLSPAAFDVLATLKRSGAPYQMRPNELINAMMVTSGTMTHRLDLLEKDGLVERKRAVDDGRSFVVQLTHLGHDRIKQAIGDHTSTQKTLLAGLTQAEQESLDVLLKKLMSSLIHS